MVDTGGEATGFAYLLPYLEADNTLVGYDIKQVWWWNNGTQNNGNQFAVMQALPVFLCPSNGIPLLDATIYGEGASLPTVFGNSDYALCRGANASLHWNWTKLPLEVRGVFNIERDGVTDARVRIVDISDGTSSTLAIGDATSGSPFIKVMNPNTGATDPAALLIQPWGAANFGPVAAGWKNNYYGSVFAVTAQFGQLSPPGATPMNLNPAQCTAVAGDLTGNNSGNPKDLISGFRSLHPGGCNFLFCDGSVRFILDNINLVAYQGLSTYAGGETVEE